MLESLGAACDRVRRPCLRALLGIPGARACFREPRRRIVIGQLLSIATAACLALTAPLVSLWLGAALFGVPHVVASVRYVGLHERVSAATRGIMALAMALGAAQLCGAGSWAPRAYPLLFGAAVLAELAREGDGRGGRLRSSIIALSVLVIAPLGAAWPALFFVAMAHGHAVCAVVHFARRARQRAVPTWPFLLGLPICAAALAGSLDGLLAAKLWAPGSAVGSIIAEATGAAPLSGSWLRRLLFVYAFGQALQYAVWLRLVPEVERQAPIPQTVGRALALLQVDLARATVPTVVCCLVAAPLLLIGGGRAREAYFALTYIHFGLELAALVAFAPSPQLAQPRWCAWRR
jgi:hypothetical protein